MEPRLKQFIERMPKLELHLHIEGTLEPEMVFQKADEKKKEARKIENPEEKNKEIEKFTLKQASADDLKAAYKFNNLGEFLDQYYQGTNVIITEQDFYDMTKAYLDKVASQNVKHVEIFFDPQTHTRRGVAFDTMMQGITEALEAAKKEHGITSKLIMSFLRDVPEKHTDETRAKDPMLKDALETLEQAKPYIRDGVIAGIGLDSYEAKEFPPSNFKQVFADAKAEFPDLKLMAHAGEEGPPDFVHQALNLPNVDRIDHGNRSIEDKELVARLAQEGMGLTVCPLSNLRLCGIRDEKGDKIEPQDLRHHPLKKMLDAGLKVTVNSDDPAYFRTDDNKGGYMTENYLAIAEALNLTREDVVQLAHNAIAVSFMSEIEKEEHHNALDRYVNRWIGFDGAAKAAAAR